MACKTSILVLVLSLIAAGCASPAPAHATGAVPPGPDGDPLCDAATAGCIGAQPGRVLAVVDSGINPYHALFQSRPPSGAVARAGPLLQDAPSLPYTTGKDFPESRQADQALWSAQEPGRVYRVPSSHVLATVSFARDAWGSLDLDGHGTAAAGQVALLAPNVGLIAVKTDAAGLPDALAWVARQPGIDAVLLSSPELVQLARDARQAAVAPLRSFNGSVFVGNPGFLLPGGPTVVQVERSGAGDGSDFAAQASPGLPRHDSIQGTFALLDNGTAAATVAGLALQATATLDARQAAVAAALRAAAVPTPILQGSSCLDEGWGILGPEDGEKVEEALRAGSDVHDQQRAACMQAVAAARAAAT